MILSRLNLHMDLDRHKCTAYPQYVWASVAHDLGAQACVWHAEMRRASTIHQAANPVTQWEKHLQKQC